MSVEHHGAAWASARKTCLANATHCALCGQPLDFSLKAPNDGTPSADHIIPASKGGPMEQWNLRPAHLGCNKRRGNRDTPLTLTTTQEW